MLWFISVFHKSWTAWHFVLKSSVPPDDSHWRAVGWPGPRAASEDQWAHVWKATFFHLSHNIHVCIASSKCLTNKIRRSRNMFHRYVCMASEYLFLDPFSPQTSRFIVPTACPHLNAYCTIQMLNAPELGITVSPFCPGMESSLSTLPSCPTGRKQLWGWNSQQPDWLS